MHCKFELKIVLYLIIIFFLTIWIYLPGLEGPFELDDYGTITNNGYLKIDSFSLEDLWQASLSTDTGPLKRPVAMLSFAVNHVLTGMDPWWMKLTNLVIHIVNGLLVLLVLRQLIPRLYDGSHSSFRFIPYLVAGLWLVHPINVTAVSYVVQRMTSLSATFVLLAIYCYLNLREKASVNYRYYIISFSLLLFWLLGLLTKETAILLSIYIFIIEYFVYRFQTYSMIEKTLLRMLWALMAAPWFFAICYVLIEPSFILDGYERRTFTITERILTEFRILIEYIRLIIVPDVSSLGLLHDEIMSSESLLQPISTLLSMLSIIGLLAVAIVVRKKSPLFCIGVFWFFGGHLLESTIFSLELMFLHRNYLPSIGILLSVTAIGVPFYQKYSKLINVTSVLIFLSFSICTRSVVHHWSGDPRTVIMDAINNPKSVRANYKVAQLYSNIALASDSDIERSNYRNEAEKYFNRVIELNPQDITGELSVLENYLRFGEIPPKNLLDKLPQKMSTAKITLGATDVFISIMRCLTIKACSLEHNEFHKLLEALLSNTSISGRQRGEIQGNYAAYVLSLENNLDKAISIVLQASDNEPSMLELYELLIYYYELSGNIEAIKGVIDTLEDKDKLGRFNKYIRKAREFSNG